MNLINKQTTISHDLENEMESQSVRTLSITLVLITSLLIAVLLFGNILAFSADVIKMIIAIDLVALLCIRMGYYKLSKSFIIIFGNLLVSIFVFNRPDINPYQIYMLTTFHLFLLFISTLITYNILYAYISMGLATVSIVLHYINRSIPNSNMITTGDIDTYTVCLGLIIISFIMINKILHQKLLLLNRVKKESADNFDKAHQLELANNSLLASYNEIKAAERKYRTLVETATDAIFIAQDGRIKFSNQRTVEIFGYSEEELLKKHFQELIHPDYRKTVMERYRARIIGDKPVNNYSFRVIKKNGDYIWVQLNVGFILWEEKSATLNYLRDITKQKEIEIQYRQAQKMEVIGTLAGGIAHDFNNILTGIFGYTQLAKNHLNNQERAGKYLDQVMKAGQKASDLVQQILTVSRQSENEKHLIQISLVVKEALKLLRASIPSTIRIKKELFSDKYVMADPTKIHQVVMNLCTNAYHAMFETGGTMAIGLREIEISGLSTIGKLKIPPGKYLELEVSDTGNGMDPETLEKIFNPYFTTKTTQKGIRGTGLGLALISGIVEEHRGYINVYSEPGRGSAFHVFLPIAEKEPDPDGSGEKKEKEEKKEILCNGTERIMVVDDDEDILLSIRELLEDYGYKIHTFKNGLQAFEAFENAPDYFDLIVTDMTMPLMTGWELAQKILEQKPRQQIFLCTGYSESINKEKALSIGVSGYFRKPLILNDMLKEIRCSIDKNMEQGKSI